MTIDKNTIIKDLIASHPETVQVFRKYNLVIAGGVRGPNEPLAFFAKAHEVDYETLVRELNEAIEKGSGEQVETPTFEEDRVYEKFAKTAILITLTAGVTIGAIILSYIAAKLGFSSVYYAIVQVHGHAQLFGWVGLCVIGFSLYIIPRVKNTELRHRNLITLCYGLIVTGILLRVVIQPMSLDSLRFLLPASSFLELASVCLFSFIILRTLAASLEKAAVFDKFFKAGIIWFLIAALVNAAMVVYSFANNLYEIPKAVFSPFVHLFLFGFVLMFIFAVNIRTVYAFLDVRQAREGAVNFTFWILNLSLPVYFVASAFAGENHIALRLSQFVVFPMAFALFSFIYGLCVFERSTRELEGVVMDRSYTKTIRAAYLWLIVSTLILIVLPFLGQGSEIQKRFHGSLNHAVTVGFITMMIIGYASKMIPTFRGVDMYSIRLSDMTFVLLNIGCFLRVFSQMLVGVAEENRIFYSALGVSGWFETAALAIFGYNIWKTMNIREEAGTMERPEPAEITKDSKVADVVERYPQTLQIFLDFGFNQIANPAMLKTMGHVATIDMATRMHNVDREKFIEALNAAIRAAGR